ncbi:hypothetical protein NDU88_002600 [Pleurodeles waltl]|uniref:Uncharacterized protein n=1 Tax=Pleurodeles waltl TaxID=8319 RepID=A0AAV7KUN2_PLEWA|nr:hypothetical protein NDU88_002600 [Pleurodeles waltl]
MPLTTVQKIAITPLRRQNTATAITTHSSESTKIQTPTQVRHTKGTLPNVTGQEVPDIPEEAHSDDSISAQLDQDD